MKSNKHHPPITVEQSFNMPLQPVWDALTNHKQMIQWFFNNIPDFKSEVGFNTRFKVSSGKRIFTHVWRILEVINNKKIKYHWSYEEYEGVGFVIFELFEKENQTLLRVTNEGLESFPEDIPEFSRESCTQGWEYFIQNNLKKFLDNPKHEPITRNTEPLTT